MHTNKVSGAAAPQRLATAVVVALVTAALTFTAASPAMAGVGDADDPNVVGVLTLSPTSGTSADTRPFTASSTTVGCPEGFRASSRTLLVAAPGIPNRALAAARTTGLDAPMSYTGTAASAAALAGSTWGSIAEGENFKILITCDATVLGNTAPYADSRYFAANLLKTSGTTWEVVAAGAPKTVTTTALTVSDVTAVGATLTATVTPAAATGNVAFTMGAVALGTATVTNGVATLTVTDKLTPGTSYAPGTVTAAYAGDATHEASTGSNPTSFSTPAPSDSSTSNIGLTVPAAGSVNEPGDLTISVKPTGVTLTGGARTANTPWTATGSLGNVAVLDDRRNASGAGWSLSGSATVFAGSGTAEGQTIPASALAWSGASGATGFVAGTLDQARVLSTGAASAETDKLTTITGTQLTLTVPASNAAGGYTSTLTLTLI